MSAEKTPTNPKAGNGASPAAQTTQVCPFANAPNLSRTGADTVTTSKAYQGCPDGVKADVHSKDFSPAEKQQLEEVVNKYKPLMKCANTPLKTIGRTDKMISHNSAGDCYSEQSTMGEWFQDKGGLVLSDNASKPVDFPDKDTQFKGTAAHEMSHAMMNKFDPRTCTGYASQNDNPLMQEYRKAAGWDATGNNLTETATDKAPTDYAKTNSAEDLAESTMLYLYDPEKLKKASPARYAFVDKLFK